MWWVEHREMIFGVVGVIGTLLSIVGLYLAVVSWKRKKLFYLTHSNNIFSGLVHPVPDVEVKFSGYGQPLPALTVTKLVFWNTGTDTIRKQDVVKEDPLTICVKEGTVILSAIVADAINPLNKIEVVVNRERTRATITFEYLERKQGAVIQVFHSGTEKDALTLKGTIMGPTPIKGRPVAGNDTPKPKWQALFLLGILWCFWMTGFLIEVFSPPLLYEQVPSPDSIPVTKKPIDGIPFLIATGCLICSLTLVALYVMYFAFTPKMLSRLRSK